MIGKVQGVFYRAATLSTAQNLGLKGFVRNEPNGNVYIEAEGEEEQIEKFVTYCYTGSPRSEVKEIKTVEGEIKNYPDFSIQR